MRFVTEGLRLARSLESFADDHAIVLGIPRGGILLAEEVAHALGAPLDVLIAGKVCTASGAPVAGVAAGSAVVDDRASEDLASAQIERLLHDEQARQVALLERIRGSWPLPELDRRTVILVDDAVITGLTMRAAIAAVEGRGAERIVVATPLCSTSASVELAALAHYVVRLVTLPDAIATDMHLRAHEAPQEELGDLAIRARITAPREPILLDGDGASP